ncbi:hypothetical protein CTAYLR_002807 [Chrysophaeum taylorii]|uniref:phosphoribosylaminoimidazolesuccinocarboxamide synthase n=1 Tax=Chrysophaeum taylorii TaxID=2483200 RepID=A0AAD7XJ11_9STRA|nr:hypothetical protein CTAYLR_002807 [Chrysophaeum taylorii]
MGSVVEEAEARTRTYHARISEALGREEVGPVVEEAEVYTGKVRDVYRPKWRSDIVVLFATGRQSAFDRQLAVVPFKGIVLNKISWWWFEMTRDLSPNHAIACPEPSVLIAERTTVFPVEFVVRGYMTGSTATSMWTHYKNGARTYCGIALPEGMVKNQKLDPVVVTPTTKDRARDEPISPADIIASGRMTQADWDFCAATALDIFRRGQEVAAARGLILVDTKYEFGKTTDGRILLVDELHTPDSSRYWLAASYEQRHAAGLEPENVDKEFLRLWYRDRCDPYEDATIPEAPADLVCELSRRYILLYELITGQKFDCWEPATTQHRASLVRQALDALPVTSSAARGARARVHSSSTTAARA